MLLWFINQVAVVFMNVILLLPVKKHRARLCWELGVTIITWSLNVEIGHRGGV